MRRSLRWDLLVGETIICTCENRKPREQKGEEKNSHFTTQTFIMAFQTFLPGPYFFPRKMSLCPFSAFFSPNRMP